MIKINRLRVDRDGKTICQVDDFTASRGERIAVVGANGSGKTTFLRVLAGLITDFSGVCQMHVDGKQRTYVHQQPLLFRGSVVGNVRYGQRGRAAVSPSATELLDRLGVGALTNRSTRNLSGGEIRRIALARALACRAQLLMLDEPLADLDVEAAAAVCQVLGDLPNTTLLIASPVDPPAELACRRFFLEPPAE